MLLNEVTIAGNVGSDARDGATQNGTRVVTFSLAHNEKGKDGRQDVTTWVRVKVFGGWCDFAASCKKGDNVFVKGKLNVQTYKDKNGVERTSVDVIPFAMGRFDREGAPRAQGQGQGQNRGGGGQYGSGFGGDDTPGLDDIPF